MTAGTPNYMAPELFLAKAYSTPNPNPNPKLQAYSTPVDVFAFAVLLNELLSREVPWVRGRVRARARARAIG